MSFLLSVVNWGLLQHTKPGSTHELLVAEKWQALQSTVESTEPSQSRCELPLTFLTTLTALLQELGTEIRKLTQPHPAERCPTFAKLLPQLSSVFRLIAARIYVIRNSEWWMKLFGEALRFVNDAVQNRTRIHPCDMKELLQVVIDMLRCTNPTTLGDEDGYKDFAEHALLPYLAHVSLMESEDGIVQLDKECAAVAQELIETAAHVAGDHLFTDNRAFRAFGQWDLSFSLRDRMGRYRTAEPISAMDLLNSEGPGKEKKDAKAEKSEEMEEEEELQEEVNEEIKEGVEAQEDTPKEGKEARQAGKKNRRGARKYLPQYEGATEEELLEAFNAMPAGEYKWDNWTGKWKEKWTREKWKVFDQLQKMRYDKKADVKKKEKPDYWESWITRNDGTQMPDPAVYGSIVLEKWYSGMPHEKNFLRTARIAHEKLTKRAMYEEFEVPKTAIRAGEAAHEVLCTLVEAFEKNHTEHAVQHQILAFPALYTIFLEHFRQSSTKDTKILADQRHSYQQSLQHHDEVRQLAELMMLGHFLNLVMDYFARVANKDKAQRADTLTAVERLLRLALVKGIYKVKIDLGSNGVMLEHLMYISKNFVLPLTERATDVSDRWLAFAGTRRILCLSNRIVDEDLVPLLHTLLRTPVKSLAVGDDDPVVALTLELLRTFTSLNQGDRVFNAFFTELSTLASADPRGVYWHPEFLQGLQALVKGASDHEDMCEPFRRKCNQFLQQAPHPITDDWQRVFEVYCTVGSVIAVSVPVDLINHRFLSGWADGLKDEIVSPVFTEATSKKKDRHAAATCPRLTAALQLCYSVQCLLGACRDQADTSVFDALSLATKSGVVSFARQPLDCARFLQLLARHLPASPQLRTVVRYIVMARINDVHRFLSCLRCETEIRRAAAGAQGGGATGGGEGLEEGEREEEGKEEEEGKGEEEEEEEEGKGEEGEEEEGVRKGEKRKAAEEPQGAPDPKRTHSGTETPKSLVQAAPPPGSDTVAAVEGQEAAERAAIVAQQAALAADVLQQEADARGLLAALPGDVRRCVDTVFEALDMPQLREADMGTTWSGEVHDVGDAAKEALAGWCVIATNAQVLSEYCSDEQMAAFAQCYLTLQGMCVAAEEGPEPPEQTAPLSFAGSLSGLQKNAAFQNCERLRDAVLSGIKKAAKGLQALLDAGGQLRGDSAALATFRAGLRVLATAESYNTVNCSRGHKVIKQLMKIDAALCEGAGALPPALVCGLVIGVREAIVAASCGVPPPSPKGRNPWAVLEDSLETFSGQEQFPRLRAITERLAVLLLDFAGRGAELEDYLRRGVDKLVGLKEAHAAVEKRLPVYSAVLGVLAREYWSQYLKGHGGPRESPAMDAVLRQVLEPLEQVNLGLLQRWLRANRKQIPRKFRKWAKQLMRPEASKAAEQDEEMEGNDADNDAQIEAQEKAHEAQIEAQDKAHEGEMDAMEVDDEGADAPGGSEHCLSDIQQLLAHILTCYGLIGSEKQWNNASYYDLFKLIGVLTSAMAAHKALPASTTSSVQLMAAAYDSKMFPDQQLAMVYFAMELWLRDAADGQALMVAMAMSRRQPVQVQNTLRYLLKKWEYTLEGERMGTEGRIGQLMPALLKFMSVTLSYGRGSRHTWHKSAWMVVQLANRTVSHAPPTMHPNQVELPLHEHPGASLGFLTGRPVLHPLVIPALAVVDRFLTLSRKTGAGDNTLFIGHSMRLGGTVMRFLDAHLVLLERALEVEGVQPDDGALRPDSKQLQRAAARARVGRLCAAAARGVRACFDPALRHVVQAMYACQAEYSEAVAANFHLFAPYLCMVLTVVMHRARFMGAIQRAAQSLGAGPGAGDPPPLDPALESRDAAELVDRVGRLYTVFSKNYLMTKYCHFIIINYCHCARKYSETFAVHKRALEGALMALMATVRNKHIFPSIYCSIDRAAKPTFLELRENFRAFMRRGSVRLDQLHSEHDDAQARAEVEEEAPDLG